MLHSSHTLDGRQTAGRKGIAYDWQSLVAEQETRDLDRELAALVEGASVALDVNAGPLAP